MCYNEVHHIMENTRETYGNVDNVFRHEIKFEDSFCDDGSIKVLEFIRSDASSGGEAASNSVRKKKPGKRKAKGTPKRKRKPKPGTISCL